MSEAVYKKLYNEILHELRDGRYAVGDYLLSLRAASLKSGSSLITVKKAYSMLEDCGYIKAVQGKGFRIIRLPNKPDKTDTQHDKKEIIAELRTIKKEISILIERIENIEKNNEF